MIYPPYSHEIGSGNPAHMPKTTTKLGVYGSYKKGFHNHEMLGEDAKFVGMDKVKGVMYLVDGPQPYPLFYIDSIRTTMKRDYVIELYDIEAEKYVDIQTKELKENGRLVKMTIDGETYRVFVTDKERKPEPYPNDFIKEFIKKEFSAYIYGPLTIYALDKDKAEEQLTEMFEKAAECLDTEKHEEAALVLTTLDKWVGEKDEVGPVESPIQKEDIQTA